jgi:hypothetical protein
LFETLTCRRRLERAAARTTNENYTGLAQIVSQL